MYVEICPAARPATPPYSRRTPTVGRGAYGNSSRYLVPTAVPHTINWNFSRNSRQNQRFKHEEPDFAGGFPVASPASAPPKTKKSPRYVHGPLTESDIPVVRPGFHTTFHHTATSYIHSYNLTFRIPEVPVSRILPDCSNVNRLIHAEHGQQTLLLPFKRCPS